jgi:hypothetical protein
MSGPRVWSPDEVRALGVRTDVATAGEILGGLCRSEAYELAKRGDFPVPVIKVGRRLIVPTAPIIALIRIGPPPDTDVAGTVPPDPAKAPDHAAPAA